MFMVNGEDARQRQTGGVQKGFFTDPIKSGVALVTGGAVRLGARISHDLASLGFSVALTYHRSGDAALDLTRKIEREGGVARPFSLDLADPENISFLVASVERHLGPISLLVNNAGVFLADSGPEGWALLEHQLKINLQGPLWLSMEVARSMEQAGIKGQIITIADIWGERPLSRHAAYGAAKAGMIMATQVLARDLAPDIRVNAIAPGAVYPPPKEDPGYTTMRSRTPLAAASGADAVLAAIHYLLEAGFVTGEVLHVDGGRRLA
ncbi:MAG: SDR family NAD(P)-dependent oxidoreductase [Magnetococcales bacterium]|nr:SDR family NAD(P)-dependent oxidoreductase [Magnetococcales bacterium]